MVKQIAKLPEKERKRRRKEKRERRRNGEPQSKQSHKAKSTPKFKKKVRKDHICNKI